MPPPLLRALAGALRCAALQAEGAEAGGEEGAEGEEEAEVPLPDFTPGCLLHFDFGEEAEVSGCSASSRPVGCWAQRGLLGTARVHDMVPK